ncbi:hypothetical protein GP486_006628, partial [Trichoglossum hirsutum]
LPTPPCPSALLSPLVGSAELLFRPRALRCRLVLLVGPVVFVWPRPRALLLLSVLLLR